MIIYISAVWLENLLLHIHRVGVAVSAGEKSVADLQPAGEEGVDVVPGGEEVAHLPAQVLPHTGGPAGVAALQTVVNREGEAETLVVVGGGQTGYQENYLIITRYCSM